MDKKSSYQKLKDKITRLEKDNQLLRADISTILNGPSEDFDTERHRLMIMTKYNMEDQVMKMAWGNYD